MVGRIEIGFKWMKEKSRVEWKIHNDNDLLMNPVYLFTSWVRGELETTKNWFDP